MKVVVIYGQQHHGNTYKLTKQLLKKLTCAKEEIQEFYTNGIPQCIGCVQCVMKDEALCPHKEQTKPMIQAMSEADVIVLASPTYCMEMSGQLKSFCDHMAYAWIVHRPYDMRKKIGVTISTAAGSGASGVTKQMKKQLFWWSVGKTYCLPLNVRTDNFEAIDEKRKQKIEKQTSKLANQINRYGGKGKQGLKSKIYFKIMKLMHQNASWNEVETEYWKKNGWIK